MVNLTHLSLWPVFQTEPHVVGGGGGRSYRRPNYSRGRTMEAKHLPYGEVNQPIGRLSPPKVITLPITSVSDTAITAIF